MEKQILTLSTRMTACCSLAHNHGHVYASIGIFFLFNIIVIDFWSIFCLEIYSNNIYFYFLKFIFIVTSQNNKRIKANKKLSVF
jgi:hypothetical protein